MASDKPCHCPNIMKGDVFSLPFRLSPVKERLVIQNCHIASNRKKHQLYNASNLLLFFYCTLKRINLQKLIKAVYGIESWK